jgi:small ligand-binding sensory domain FIST
MGMYLSRALSPSLWVARLDCEGVISQGCTPIGETWTLTKVEQNIIHEIGNRPAYQVLAETFNQLSAEDQKKARRQHFHWPGGE